VEHTGNKAESNANWKRIPVMIENSVQEMRRRPRLLNVSEVADWLHVSEGWIRDHATGRRRPVLPSIKLGKAIRFDEAKVDEWLQRLQGGW
jgi:predicted DNA-binding transcriptional regulator AlpA